MTGDSASRRLAPRRPVASPEIQPCAGLRPAIFQYFQISAIARNAGQGYTPGVLLAGAIRFTRRNLPHLEVEGGRYFVTVRCAASLPHDVVVRLQELQRDLGAADRPSDQLATLQRRYFRTMERYLDSGLGNCVLRDPAAAEALASEFGLLAEWRICVPHYSIMRITGTRWWCQEKAARFL